MCYFEVNTPSCISNSHSSPSVTPALIPNTIIGLPLFELNISKNRYYVWLLLLKNMFSRIILIKM